MNRQPPLPAFAALLSFSAAKSSRFIAPREEIFGSALDHRIVTWRQDESSVWLPDASLVAHDRDCWCTGALHLFAPALGDGLCQCIGAWRQWGEDFLCHIDGEYAFALADIDNETIILVRDRFGLQSLYYSIDDKQLAVANSLAGLTFLLQDEPAINAEYMLDFLAMNVPKLNHCIYRDVHSLPPGYILVFQNGVIRTWPYWSLAADTTMLLPKDPAGRLRELIIAAVRKCLPDEGKIVVQLSGGLDSSALLGFLTKIAGRERLVAVTRTFAAGYRDKKRDELAYAKDAARYCGVPLVVVDEEVTNPLPALEEYFQRMGNFSPNPYYAVAEPIRRKTAELGNGTIFSGYGGDEAVSLPGDIALPWLFLHGRWPTLWRKLGEISQVYSHSRWKLFRHWLLPKLLSRQLEDCIDKLRFPEESRLKYLDLMTSDAKKQIMVSIGKKEYFFRHRSVIVEEIRLGLLGAWFVLVKELNNFDLWRDGGHQLFPYLDKDVISYMASLPPEMFLLDGWKRGLFRRAIRGLVPDSILTRRTKSVFSLPLPIYVRAAEQMIMDMCHTANHPAWDYLDRRALAFFTRRVCREEISQQTELAAVVVGRTVVMAMFLGNRQRYWLQKRAAD